MTRFAVAGPLVAALAGCAGAQTPQSTPAVAALQAPAPALIVVITVDQLRPDYFTRWSGQTNGGLARLYTGGAVFSNAFQDHGITETAPGHSTILSGRFPRSTGITANAFGVNTDSAPLIASTSVGASPFRFKGTTLVDWLVARDSRTRVLSVSRKDRGAILPVGTSRQQVYWYGSPGLFTTSRYYADTLPTWVRAFNARQLPRESAGKVWSLLLPESEYPEPDSVLVESAGREVVFPHRAPGDSALAATALGNYPWMDEITLEFALEGMRAMNLGRGPQTDVLAISLSTMDAIGHRYGPDSREVHDFFLRLDRYLAAFFQRLYAERDSGSIVVALTADHGVNPFPEARSKYDRNDGAGRVAIYDVLAAARKSLANAKVDTNAVSWSEAMLFVDRAALARANVQPETMANSIAAAVAKVPGVWRADTWRALTRADTSKDYVSRRWLHMVNRDYPVDVFVTMRPHWDLAGGPPIANHGSPHDYDAKVPVIFYGPWIRRGQYATFARVVDIGPTLAAIAGVTPSERLDGRVLRAALLRPPIEKDSDR